MAKSNVVAIDGPAASGKSTVAKLLSERLNIAYVNTGSLYRAVALGAINAKIDLATVSLEFLRTLKLEYAVTGLGTFELMVNGDFPGVKLRSPEVSSGASLVAAQAVVRDYLLEVQRAFAGTKLIVMEGRDIGTVIFPDARFKFFVTAAPEERARRRLAQAGEVPDHATLEVVAREIAERDRLDSERAIAPLRPAPDAELIDTTGLSIEEVVVHIVNRIRARGAEYVL